MAMMEQGIGKGQHRMQLEHILELLQGAPRDVQIIELGSQHSHEHARDDWIIP